MPLTMSISRQHLLLDRTTWFLCWFLLYISRAAPVHLQCILTEGTEGFFLKSGEQVDRNADRLISRVEFAAAIRDMQARGALSLDQAQGSRNESATYVLTSDPGPQWHLNSLPAFDDMDINHDGVVDRHEFIRTHAGAGRSLTGPQGDQPPQRSSSAPSSHITAVKKALGQQRDERKAQGTGVVAQQEAGARCGIRGGSTGGAALGRGEASGVIADVTNLISKEGDHNEGRPGGLEEQHKRRDNRQPECTSNAGNPSAAAPAIAGFDDMAINHDGVVDQQQEFIHTCGGGHTKNKISEEVKAMRSSCRCWHRSAAAGSMGCGMRGARAHSATRLVLS